MNRKVLAIAAAACVAVAAAWYFFAWSPGQSAMNAAHTRKDAAEKQQADLTVKLSGLKAASKTLPDMKAKIAALKAAIPADSELDKVLATVNDAANGAGVNLTALSPTPPAGIGKPAASAGATTGGAAAQSAASSSNTAVPTIGITMSAAGSYFQVVDFVNRLNNSPRLVVVDNVAFSAQGGNKDQNATVQAQLVGRMFMSGGK
jgi:Tfp pilus assembly protein PilO